MEKPLAFNVGGFLMKFVGFTKDIMTRTYYPLGDHNSSQTPTKYLAGCKAFRPMYPALPELLKLSEGVQQKVVPLRKEQRKKLGTGPQWL